MRSRILDPQLAPGDAGERHEAADLDVIGRDRVLGPAQRLRAVDREQVRSDPLDIGAHLDQHPRQVLDVRLAGRVADDRGAGNQRRCHERVLGRHHGGLVQEHITRVQPVGGVEQDVAPGGDLGTHRAEGVQMRVQPPTTDDVASGRRHDGAAKAGKQRPGQQEGGADLLRQLGVHLDRGGAGGVVVPARLVGPRGLVHDRRAERHVVGAEELHAHADRAEDREHRVDVADARDIADDHLLLGEEAGGEDRQRGVLVTRRCQRPLERDAAVDDELLHAASRLRARGR